MHLAARLIAFCFVLFLSETAFADTLTGKVGRVVDGDTLYVLDANYKEHKIRLAGIDAPERKQAYGLASRKHLASIVAGQPVTIEYKKRDRTVTLRTRVSLQLEVAKVRHKLLVYQVERRKHIISSAGADPHWVAPLPLDHGVDEIPRWPLWARSSSAFRRGEDIKFLRPAIVGLPT